MHAYHYLLPSTCQGPVTVPLQNLNWCTKIVHLPGALYADQSCWNIDTATVQISTATGSFCQYLLTQPVLFQKLEVACLDCKPPLFRSCSICVSQLSGCCCLDCTCAPRLRPVLPGHQRYEKWHMYRSCEQQRKIQVSAFISWNSFKPTFFYQSSTNCHKGYMKYDKGIISSRALQNFEYATDNVSDNYSGSFSNP